MDNTGTNTKTDEFVTTWNPPGLVSVWDHCAEAKKPTNRRPDEIIVDIRSGKWKHLIDELNSFEHGSKAQKNFKTYKMPAVTFAGIFSYRDTKHFTDHSGLFAVDYDHIPEDKYQFYFKKITESPYTWAAFRSPRRDGIKAIIRIPDNITNDQDHRAYVKEYHKIHKLDFVDEFSDIARLCIVSHDPDLYFNPDAEAWTYKAAEPEPEPKPEDNGTPLNIEEYTEIFERLVKWELNKAKYYDDGNKQKFYVSILCACNRFGIPEGEAAKLAFDRFANFEGREQVSREEINKIAADTYLLYKAKHKTAKFEDEKNYLDLFYASIINTDEDVPEPPAALKIGAAIWGTLGNFSLVIGKAKSRKSFLMTAAMAAIGQSTTVLNITGCLPEDKNTAIYFDTEQSKFHAHRNFKRIFRQLDGVSLPNVIGAGLRKYTPTERLEIIEAAIYNTPNLGLVIIDGIIDLMNDGVMERAEAVQIASKLLKWTEELNIHIITVLHMNKADKNARGHAGTEFQNKAETVLSIEKDEKDKEISVVRAEYCRDIEPDPFAFTIADGLPELTNEWEIKTLNKTESKSVSANEINSGVHYSVLHSVFDKREKPLRSDLISGLKNQFAIMYNQKFGDNKLRDFIEYYEANGYIVKNESNKTTERFYQLIEKEEDEVPF